MQMMDILLGNMSSHNCLCYASPKKALCSCGRGKWSQDISRCVEANCSENCLLSDKLCLKIMVGSLPTSPGWTVCCSSALRLSSESRCISEQNEESDFVTHFLWVKTYYILLVQQIRFCSTGMVSLRQRKCYSCAGS